MDKQIQKGGDQSTNIQADSVQITTGVSYAEARQIALDVFRANFAQLSKTASETARSRAEAITDDFLARLSRIDPSGVATAQDPDFQYALLGVQREFARTGDKNLGDLLVDLLVDRTKVPMRSILQIVLNESLVVAPKLTEDQLSTLSLAFFFKNTTARNVFQMDQLLANLDRFVAPLLGNLTKNAAGFQHLEFAGCASNSMFQTVLAQILKANYSVLFSKGFDRSELAGRNLETSAMSAFLMTCQNDPEKLQINCQNNNVLAERAKAAGFTQDQINSMTNLIEGFLLGDKEVKDLIVAQRSYMAEVFDSWANSPLNALTLTSVGIAIGHANIKRRSGAFTDLSIWIN